MKRRNRWRALELSGDRHAPFLARFAGAIALATLLTGCAVGPDFVKPSPPAVNNYTSSTAPVVPAPAGGKQTVLPGKDIPGQWWRLYGSKPLNQLIEQALRRNPDLRSAEAALGQARENADAQVGSLFPALDASGLVRRQKTSGALFGSPGAGSSLFTLYNASVNVSYTLDVFGGVRRQIESLAAQADYQRFQLEAAYLTLTSNIVTTAIQESSLREQIAATRDIVDTQTRQLGLVEQRFELGAVAKSDVLAQQAALAQTQTNLPPLELQLAQARHRLTVLAGRFPSDEVEARFQLSDLHLPEELPLSLPSRLVRQRPDVRAQEALLHSASADIGVATANMLPNLTISASLASIATQASNLFMPGSGIWNVGANLTQPLFHGGQLLHKRRAAVQAYQQAAEQYRGTVLQAFRELADVLRAIDYDNAELAAQDVAVRTAAESLELAGKQFEIGATGFLELLNAQRTYHDTRIGLAKARAARYADTAALFLALGGGWWNRFDDAAVEPAVWQIEEKRDGF